MSTASRNSASRLYVHFSVDGSGSMDLNGCSDSVNTVLSRISMMEVAMDCGLHSLRAVQSANLDVRVGVSKFDNESKLLVSNASVGSVSDVDLIGKQIKIRPEGGTCFVSAVLGGLVDIATVQASPWSPDHCVLIVITDGEDTDADIASGLAGKVSKNTSLVFGGIGVANIPALAGFAKQFKAPVFHAFDPFVISDTMVRLVTSLAVRYVEPPVEFARLPYHAVLEKLSMCTLSEATQALSSYTGPRTGNFQELMLACSKPSFFRTWGRNYIWALLSASQYGLHLSSLSEDTVTYETPLAKKFYLKAVDACKHITLPAMWVNPDWEPTVYPEDNVSADEIAAMKSHVVKKTNVTNTGNTPATQCVEGGCFDSAALVTCLNSEGDVVYIKASELLPGMRTKDNTGNVGVISGVFLSTVTRDVVTLTDGHTSNKLAITQHHPVKHKGKWTHPNTVGAPCVIDAPLSVCSVLLDAVSRQNRVVSITANGFDVICLGHDIENDEVATHAFFGCSAVMDRYVAFLTENYPGRPLTFDTGNMANFHLHDACGAHGIALDDVHVDSS